MTCYPIYLFFEYGCLMETVGGMFQYLDFAYGVVLA